MRTLISPIFILVLLIPPTAIGQSKPKEESKVKTKIQPESTLLKHNNHPGFWFPSAKAKELLKAAGQLPKIKLALEKTEQLLELRDERIKLLDKNAITERKIAEIWKDTAKNQAKLLSSKEAWWRSPYFWMTVGVIAGAAGAIGTAAVVKQAGIVK